MSLFQHAIVRPPCASFPHGLSSANLGTPDLDLALEQHQAYCDALEKCGLTLTVLEPDARFPDSTFVEDTAVLTPRSAVLTHPGAPSRQGEVPRIGETLSHFYPTLQTILPPGTLEGGDICQAGDHFFIGISDRTNAAGAQQLSEILEAEGYTTSFLDVRGGELLHLKSGIAYLGDQHLIHIDGMEKQAIFADYEIIPVEVEEGYAANCLRVNDFVLLAAGFPKIAARLNALGYATIILEMSEFQKMDGGLSCLSLRF